MSEPSQDQKFVSNSIPTEFGDTCYVAKLADTHDYFDNLKS